MKTRRRSLAKTIGHFLAWKRTQQRKRRRSLKRSMAAARKARRIKRRMQRRAAEVHGSHPRGESGSVVRPI